MRSDIGGTDVDFCDDDDEDEDEDEDEDAAVVVVWTCDTFTLREDTDEEGTKIGGALGSEGCCFTLFAS